MSPGPNPKGVKRDPPFTRVNLPSSKILFNKYQVGRLLGCGAFAKVYHARNLRTNASVAIKCINKVSVLKTNLVANIKREIAIMHRLRHPHIVHLIEVLASRTKIYFVLEFVKGGELFSRISKGRLNEDVSRKIFQELISAVGFCHSRGVYHRDLKPENLLVDEFGKVKVSDFGLSAVSDMIRPDGMFHTLCGTPAYVAPEVLTKKGYDGAKVDIWSCGVILFVLNAGYLPFSDPNLMQMYRKIYKGDYKLPKWTSPELKRLISRLLDTNPATRITIEEILHDPWFHKGLDEKKMRAMMTFHAEVEDRISKVDQAAELDRELNAFDIISLSSGFDLSGLFDGKTERARFTSDESPSAILERVEEVGRKEGLVVRRKKERIGRGGIAVEGQNGNLVAWVEVYKLSPGMVMVEVEKGGGDSDVEERWNSEFWKEKLGPASEPTTPMSGFRERVFAFDMIESSSEPVSPMSDCTKFVAVDSSSETESSK